MFFLLQESKKKSMDDHGLFDDDDLLGGMGLDSPPSTTRKHSLAAADSENARPALSVLDDLLGSKKKSDASTTGLSMQKSKSEDSMDDFLSSLKSSSMY